MVKSGLGRGLASLIPKKINKEILPKTSPVYSDDSDNIRPVPVGEINPNPQQPRRDFSSQAQEELINSIREHGIIQPLIATKVGERYQLISGERRWRAAKALGLKTVPTIVREAKKQLQLELALIENIQRQNLNPMEEAVAYQRLIDEFNLTQDQLAKRVSKSRPVITNTLRLLILPEEIQKALISGKINYSTARIIVGLPESERMKFFQKAIKNQLTVRGFEGEVNRVEVRRHLRTVKDPNILSKEEILRQALGTRVNIKKTGLGGQIVIDYYSEEELVELIKKISGRA